MAISDAAANAFFLVINAALVFCEYIEIKLFYIGFIKLWKQDHVSVIVSGNMSKYWNPQDTATSRTEQGGGY